MTDAFLDESLGDRLRRTLLEGYAHDVPVTGQWLLCDDDGYLPTFEVIVTLDQAPAGTSEESESADDRVERFEGALRAVLLEAYADGEEPEGTWVASFPSARIPDWWVEITVEVDAFSETDEGDVGPGYFR